jgi:hypothetical protein
LANSGNPVSGRRRRSHHLQHLHGGARIQPKTRREREKITRNSGDGGDGNHDRRRRLEVET